MEAIRGAGSRCGEGATCQEKGAVQRVLSLLSGWRGQGRCPRQLPASSCGTHQGLAWARDSLSLSKHPGRGLTCLGTSPAACTPPARTVPKPASHQVPLTSPLAQHRLQGGLAWVVSTLSPLLASLLHPATARVRGAEGCGGPFCLLPGGDGQGSASPTH